MRRRLSRSAFTRSHISSPSVEKPPKTIKWTRGLRRGGWSVKLDTHRPAFCQLALSYWDGVLKFAAQLDWISWIQQNGLGFHWFNQIWPCKTTWMGIPVWINANKCNICCFDFNMFLYFYCIKLMVWATESPCLLLINVQRFKMNYEVKIYLKKIYKYRMDIKLLFNQIACNNRGGLPAH